ncbi:MAG TPA: hypothetical protein VMS32_11340 [Verrucomicrobiae bacterium]|nr:hypothetical protein [Verrucomicrobiae bacterium]
MQRTALGPVGTYVYGPLPPSIAPEFPAETLFGPDHFASGDVPPEAIPPLLKPYDAWTVTAIGPMAVFTV